MSTYICPACVGAETGDGMDKGNRAEQEASRFHRDQKCCGKRELMALLLKRPVQALIKLWYLSG